MSNSDALSEARRRANELLGQKDAERISARDKENCLYRSSSNPVATSRGAKGFQR
jgi:hypothetical protein